MCQTVLAGKAFETTTATTCTKPEQHGWEVQASKEVYENEKGPMTPTTTSESYMSAYQIYERALLLGCRTLMKAQLGFAPSAKTHNTRSRTSAILTRAFGVSFTSA